MHKAAVAFFYACAVISITCAVVIFVGLARTAL
jgi:hypothetical protein